MPGLTFEQLQKMGATPVNSQNQGMTFDQLKSSQSTQPVQQNEPGLLSKIGSALTSSEQAFGQDISGALTQILPKSWTGVQQLDDASKMHAATLAKTADLIKTYQAQGKDTTKLKSLLQSEINDAPPGLEDLYPSLKKTNWQIVGDAGGVLLDILSGGTYGKAAEGAVTGERLTKAGQEAYRMSQPGAEAVKSLAGAGEIESGMAKKTFGTTLKDIGTKTATRAGVGAGTGYAYDVSQNLQSGKEGTEALKPGMGTVLGGTIPTAIGGVQAGFALSKESAPRFINSLIKPRQADFSYGKDPGRTVAALGITGNNLEDFANNIRIEKQDIGRQISSIYSNPKNSDKVIDASSAIDKIDNAIKEAAKGGKSNQSVVTALQNAKDALLYEHGVDAEGNITKIGDTPRDLSNLTPQEAFDLKKLVAGQTKFTGNPSDDKAVNSVLKKIYGGLKEELNNAVGVNNPEIKDLNQKYADLTSAELATTHRDMIVKRADMISAPMKAGGAAAAGIVTALASGGTAIPAILAGAGSVALEKALSSTAVKTRIASWLGKESPSVITKVLEQNPAIKKVLYRALPKFASQLGVNNDKANVKSYSKTNQNK